jgi:NAD(P)-dependent dehydrogenase (short-subunit alcohol dehydrogenase family)
VAADKILVVTGGGRGIGAETARLAAERGYAVAVNYRENRAAAESLVKSFRGDAIAVQGDVASEADVVRLFETVDRKLGRVGALVNNAGIVDRGMRVADMTSARIARMFAINVTGSFLCAREAVKRMSTRLGGPGGAIVNVSSIAGIQPAPGLGAYAVSKAAVIHLTAQLALELSPRIRVNAVAPAVVKTQFANSLFAGREEYVAASYALGRLGVPSDVAGAVAFLASDDASWITGQTLTLDGGVSLTGGVQ